MIAFHYLRQIRAFATSRAVRERRPRRRRIPGILVTVPLAWGLFVVSWTAYLGSAILSALNSGREAMEVLGVAAAGTAVFFGRSLRSGTSLHGALLGASLFTLVILGITWGRPSRMFDLRPPHQTNFQ